MGYKEIESVITLQIVYFEARTPPDQCVLEAKRKLFGVP
jgi:hypothetical protein